MGSPWTADGNPRCFGCFAFPQASASPRSFTRSNQGGSPKIALGSVGSNGVSSEASVNAASMNLESWTKKNWTSEKNMETEVSLVFDVSVDFGGPNSLSV